MVLYADVLFAINFSMDFLTLYISGKILHKKIYKIRIIIASCVGAVYAVLSVILELSNTINIVACLICAIVMCKICFLEKRIKNYIVISFLYFIISSLLGGIMSVMYNFLNGLLQEFIINYSHTDTYNGIRFVIIALLTAIVTIIFGKVFTSKKDISIAEVKVEIKNEMYTCEGLCDSGNLLKEPLSGKFVILVAERSELGQEIKNIQDIYKRYIPYKDVNGEGIIKGIVPKKVTVNGNLVDVVIATVDNEDFNGCEALVPMAVI